MSNYNKVILMGNLTRDPELRYTGQGTAVANLGLAVNRKRKDPNGEVIEETTFIDVTAWGKTAENVSKYMKKGRSLMVDGRLHLEQWEKDGEKRSRLTVVAESVQFLGGKPQGTAPQEPPKPEAPTPP